jgi:hypothetical protein
VIIRDRTVRAKKLTFTRKTVRGTARFEVAWSKTLTDSCT